MNRAAVHQRRALRSTIPVVAMLGMVVGMLVVSTPSAGAVRSTCRATNLTQDTPSSSHLQAAINTASLGDTIAVEGVCVGSFTIDRDLTLVGKTTAQDATPVLQGERASGRVLLVAARVTLTDLMVTGGGASGDGIPTVETGGGILVRRGGTLILNRSMVRGNAVFYEGGGIANYGRLVLKDSVVSKNEAGDGGGNGHGGGIANYGTLILSGSSSVRGNTAENTGGGIENHGRLVMNDSSSVRGNTAEFGGGIALSGDHAPPGGPTVTMNASSSVSGNRAEVASDEGRGIGGGIYFNEGTVTMNDSSSVRGNRAASDGGGIFTEFGTVTLNDSSSVRENRAATGGGIFCNEGTVTLNDSSSVSGNTATGAGGIWRGSSGTLSLNDESSVSGNIGAEGENNIVETPPFDESFHLSEIPAEGFTAMAILILGAIGAGALIARPWLRAAALATITGMMGVLVFETLFHKTWHGPGDQFAATAYGWFLGVTAGALLGVVVFRLRAEGWPSEEDVWSILGSALLVLIVLAVPALILYWTLLENLHRLM